MRWDVESDTECCEVVGDQVRREEGKVADLSEQLLRSE